MTEEGKTTVTNRKFISTSNTYFDDYLKPNYWSKIAKDYKHILFKAGKPLQSRELNTLQSLFHDRVKTMCDITYRNGSVVRGISVYSNHIAAENVDDTSNIEANEDIIIRNTDGVVYWDGIFFDIEEKSINIDNQFVGKNRIVVNHNQPIYVYLIPIYEVVNSSADHNLLDPAIRYKIDEGVAGADRLSIRFELRAYNINDLMIPEQRILIAIIDSDGNVSLLNRNSKFGLDGNEASKTEVNEGLKIRNKGTYFTVDTGSGIINDEEVLYNKNEIFPIDEIKKDVFSIQGTISEENDIYKSETDLQDNTEVRILDVRNNPLSGSIWGDSLIFGDMRVEVINYESNNGITLSTPYIVIDDDNDIVQQLFMTLPGQEVSICIEINDDNQDESDFVEIATAEIAEVFSSITSDAMQKFSQTVEITPQIINLNQIVNSLNDKGHEMKNVTDYNSILTNNK